MAICSMPKKAEDVFSLLKYNEFAYLNKEKSLSRKLLIMADMLSLTKEEHREREIVVCDIFNLLRPYYPECDILVFGSSANGFGFKECDLDLLFLPFPEYCNMDFKDKGNGVIPSPYHILDGTVSRKKLYEMDEVMHLKFVQRIMYSDKQYFKKVVFIPAKVPILNIEFVRNPLHCDFSVSNRFVLHNTQLLWIYGKLDTRVKPLIIFLRFWAKSLGFISKSLLSSYCLSLLVIFFLQNTYPPLLPSAKYLIELSGYSRIIDGWETAICLDTDTINENRSENCETLSDLLMQFFDFYWNFDFVQNIVSVYEGKPLPVKVVKESKNERIRSFNVTPLSIQDPLILSRNISRNSTMKTPFKLSLLIAKELLWQREFDLRALFDISYYQSEMNAMFLQTKVNLPPKPMFFTFYLTYEIYSKLGITSHLDPWFDKVGRSIFDILQYGLLIDCEIVDKAENEVPSSKKKKFSCYNIGNMKLIQSIQCVVNFPTLWRNNRVDVLKYLKDTNGNFENEDTEIEIPASLKTEYRISKELSKDEIKDITKLPEIDSQIPHFTFFCDCFQYPESQLPDVVISISALTNHKVFRDAKDFLNSFVKKHMKQILGEL